MNCSCHLSLSGRNPHAVTESPQASTVTRSPALSFAHVRGSSFAAGGSADRTGAGGGSRIGNRLRGSIAFVSASTNTLPRRVSPAHNVGGTGVPTCGLPARTARRPCASRTTESMRRIR